MQLRTVKKPKIKDFDFGNNTGNEIVSTRKNSQSKEQVEKDLHESSNENSNLTNENESKSRHKLRNPSGNYQGKYKKMNSGKYLYKLNNSDKKPLNKKKQLRFLPLELVQTFKKFLNKLNKKEDENMLNKKKKREEKLEQSQVKVKSNDTQDNYNKKMMNKMQNLPPFNPMADFDYNQAYMMKNPYEMYYQQNYLENMKNQGFPVDNPQMFYRMNKDFMKYFNVPEYYYRAQYPQQHPFNFEQEQKPKGESIFNLLNDKESLNRINKIASQGVNHIVAAFYIKSIQQTRAKASEPNNIVRRASVPVNSVNLDDKEDNEDNQDKNFSLNMNINLSNLNTLGKNQIVNQQKEIDKDTHEFAKDEMNKNNNTIYFNDANLLNNSQNTSLPFQKTFNSEEMSNTNVDNISSKNFLNTHEQDLKTVNFFNNSSSLQNIFGKNDKINSEKEAVGKSGTNAQNYPKDNVNSRGPATASFPNRYNNTSGGHPPFEREHKSKSSFTEDLNPYTAQQLNTVSNMLKSINKNKLSESIEKDNINSGNTLKK